MVIIITAVVCTILWISYIVFSNEQKTKKEKELEQYALLAEYFKSQIASIGELELAGVGNDGNSDNQVKDAIKEIRLPDYVRVQIYD